MIVNAQHFFQKCSRRMARWRALAQVAALALLEQAHPIPLRVHPDGEWTVSTLVRSAAHSLTPHDMYRAGGPRPALLPVSVS